MRGEKIVLFRQKQIRRAWHKDEWYFSVVDVVAVLTNSLNPTDYLKKLRKRDKELGIYLGTNCPQVEMTTETGKKRKTLAGNTKDIFRLIQSIPSKNAEPFKIWLAKVGYERMQETVDPELADELDDGDRAMIRIAIEKAWPVKAIIKIRESIDIEKAKEYIKFIGQKLKVKELENFIDNNIA